MTRKDVNKVADVRKNTPEEKKHAKSNANVVRQYTRVKNRKRVVTRQIARRMRSKYLVKTAKPEAVIGSPVPVHHILMHHVRKASGCSQEISIKK